MKLQIDTKNKTIRVEGDVVFSELIETLDKMFSRKEWKKFLLKTQTEIVNWSHPIYIEKIVPYRTREWWDTTWTYSGDDTSLLNSSGSHIYNVTC